MNTSSKLYDIPSLRRTVWNRSLPLLCARPGGSLTFIHKLPRALFQLDYRIDFDSRASRQPRNANSSPRMSAGIAEHRNHQV
jgi:hypothetical protein